MKDMIKLLQTRIKSMKKNRSPNLYMCISLCLLQDAAEGRAGAARAVRGRCVVEDGLRRRARQPPLRRERLRVPRRRPTHHLRRQEGSSIRPGLVRSLELSRDCEHMTFAKILMFLRVGSASRPTRQEMALSWFEEGVQEG